jgi:antitoxin component of MazEF toxin-antitoxin module
MEVDMIKKLRKVGNSSAIILDRTVMEMVGLEESGEVQLTVRDGSIIVTPANPRLADPAAFAKALELVVSRRKSALKKLAE